MHGPNQLSAYSAQLTMHNLYCMTHFATIPTAPTRFEADPKQFALATICFVTYFFCHAVMHRRSADASLNHICLAACKCAPPQDIYIYKTLQQVHSACTVMVSIRIRTSSRTTPARPEEDSWHTGI